MKLAIIFLIIGFVVSLNSIGALFFDIPMFYELLPIDWFSGSISDGGYLKAIPAEAESFDLRYLWLFVGVVISLSGYLLFRKSKK